MKINLKDIVLTIPDDPNKISAYQYQKIRICAAKMSSLCSDLEGLRNKIANIATLINSDDKERALQELELLYYSAHLAVSEHDAANDAFVWITSRPEKAINLSDSDVKKLFDFYCAQGLTKEQVQKTIDFFLPKLQLN